MDKVIWTDEKLWEEKVRPNKQNERFWARVDPEVEVDCRVQGGRKVMCWAGLINGEVILHWFPVCVSVNQHVYMDMLQNVLWPKVKSKSTRLQYWYQQDGATAHTTVQVREWLMSKFGNRVISRLTERSWPSRSPDLSPLDFWFWAVCLAELGRNPPSSLEQLKETVEDYVGNLDKGSVIKAVRDITPRAQACKNSNGGPFEYRLKKAKKSTSNEE